MEKAIINCVFMAKSIYAWQGGRRCANLPCPAKPDQVVNSNTIRKTVMTKKTRRRYTAEFKATAVARLDQTNETVSSVAQALVSSPTCQHATSRTLPEMYLVRLTK